MGVAMASYRYTAGGLALNAHMAVGLATGV